MENRNLPGLTPAWIIVLGTIIATLLPIGVPYIFKDDIRPADWLGFAGNVVVAGVALFAAAIAWEAVQRQIFAAKEIEDAKTEREQQELALRQEVARFAAVTVLTQPVHAASAVLFAIRSYLKAKPQELVMWTKASDGAIAQLAETLNHFGLREVAGDLQIDHRLHYLMAVSRLSTMVTLYRVRPGILNERETFEMLEKQLGEMPTFLRPLDDDLANVFERDSKV
jgi:hypothetical protein